MNEHDVYVMYRMPREMDAQHNSAEAEAYRTQL